MQMPRLSFVGCLQQLRYLSLRNAVHLDIKIALPKLQALVLEVDHNLELEVEDLEIAATKYEALYIVWRKSKTMDFVSTVLEAVCGQALQSGVNKRSYEEKKVLALELPLHGYFGHCTVPSGACSACMSGTCFNKACCP